MGVEQGVDITVAGITMTVGEKVITATLDDSETSKAFLATLPRTISMSAYGEREYYGRMEAILRRVQVSRTLKVEMQIAVAS